MDSPAQSQLSEKPIQTKIGFDDTNENIKYEIEKEALRQKQKLFDEEMKLRKNKRFIMVVTTVAVVILMIVITICFIFNPKAYLVNSTIALSAISALPIGVLKIVQKLSIN